MKKRTRVLLKTLSVYMLIAGVCKIVAGAWPLYGALAAYLSGRWPAIGSGAAAYSDSYLIFFYARFIQPLFQIYVGLVYISCRNKMVSGNKALYIATIDMLVHAVTLFYVAAMYGAALRVSPSFFPSVIVLGGAALRIMGAQSEDDITNR